MGTLKKTALLAAAICALGVAAAPQASADYLVASYGTNQVLRYGNDGAYKGVFAGDTANVTHPTAMARDASGNVYVACYVTQITSYIVRLNPKGEYLANVGTGDYGWIGGLIFDNAGNLYISDTNAYWVNRLTPGGTQTVLNSGTETSPSPGGMAFDSQGRLYLACSTSGGKILRWNADGSFDKKVLDNPNLLDVDIVNLDENTQAIRAVRDDGETVGFYLGWDIDGNWTGGPYVQTQSAPTWVNSMLHVDANNVFIVGNNGIFKYTQTDQGWSGTLFAAPSPGVLSQPYGMVWAPDEVGSANALNYQGKLADSAGNPVADGPKTLTFAFFAVETGGSAVWTSDPLTVNTKGGLFTTTIPAVPATAFNSKDVWLEVTVNGETLSPRTYVSSVPFAMKALKAF